MPRSKEIQKQMRKKVIEIYQSGKGYKAISKALGLPRTTVRAIIYKWLQTHPGGHQRPHNNIQRTAGLTCLKDEEYQTASVHTVLSYPISVKLHLLSQSRIRNMAKGFVIIGCDESRDKRWRHSTHTTLCDGHCGDQGSVLDTVEIRAGHCGDQGSVLDTVEIRLCAGHCGDQALCWTLWRSGLDTVEIRAGHCGGQGSVLDTVEIRLCAGHCGDQALCWTLWRSGLDTVEIRLCAGHCGDQGWTLWRSGSVLDTVE
ncbi:hypothetical protein QTP70_027836, partial [Hemibagrus guttatus]